MIKRNIGKRIRKYRKLCDLSQDQLATAIGTSRPNISSWERDRTEPSINDVQLMADLFGCKVSDLLSQEDDTEFTAIMKDIDYQDMVLFLHREIPSDKKSIYFEAVKRTIDTLNSLK